MFIKDVCLLNTVHNGGLQHVYLLCKRCTFTV